MDSSNPSIGIKNAKIVIEKDYMVCSYTRDNSNPNSKYHKLEGKAHFIIAYYKGPGIYFYILFRYNLRLA